MLALDFLLVILTSACIVYCMILNRRIIQIQKYRAEMIKMFKEFDKSLSKAESILEETKQFAPKSEELLHSLEKKAAKQMEKIETIINNGDRLAEELETIIISGNKLATRLYDLQRMESASEKISGEEEIFLPEIMGISDRASTAEEHNERLPKSEEIERIKLSQQDYYEIIQRKRRHRK